MNRSKTVLAADY